MLWAGDTRHRLLANVTSYGGAVALVTVTAPGNDLLGDRPSMRRWNVAAPARWREMHRAAAQRARRKHGVLRMLCWSWEYQRRGALHKHVLLGVETAAERVAAHTYLRALDEHRHEHGFGFVDNDGNAKWRRRGLATIPAERAARYAAKYISKLDAAGKPTLNETIMHPDVPPLVVYVSRSLTMSTGVTMRFCRHVRHCWVLGIDPRTGELLRGPGVVPGPRPPRWGRPRVCEAPERLAAVEPARSEASLGSVTKHLN